MVNTSTRVEERSSGKINRRNQEQIDQSLERYSKADKVAIDRRLEKLDQEWTTERVIEVEAPLMIAFGAGLTYFFGRRFLPLPIFSASMLLIHGINGWYPLLPILRKLGFRSQNEILKERQGLRALRNDHQQFMKH